MSKSIKYSLDIFSKRTAFTLVELLVTITIVGILAAVSVAIFEEYRAKAYDTAALSDLQMVKSAQEAYFVDNDVYATCVNASGCLALFDPISSFSDTVGELLF